MALYRFLFAPVLLALAILSGSPRTPRAPPPDGGHDARPAASAAAVPAHAPERAARAAVPHPGAVH